MRISTKNSSVQSKLPKTKESDQQDSIIPKKTIQTITITNFSGRIIQILMKIVRGSKNKMQMRHLMKYYFKNHKELITNLKNNNPLSCSSKWTCFVRASTSAISICFTITKATARFKLSTIASQATSRSDSISRTSSNTMNSDYIC